MGSAVRREPTMGLLIGVVALIGVLIGFLAGAEPKLAIAAAIAAGFVLLVFVDLAAGLALFSFFSFLEILELGSVVSVGKLGGALLALGWLAVLATRHDAKRDFLVIHPWVSAAIGLFLGWSLLSMSWASEPGVALAVTGRYALNAVLFMIVFTAIGNRRQAMMVTGALLAGAVAATAYGIVNVNTTVYAGRIGGLSGLDPNELASALVAGVALSGALVIGLRRSPGLRMAAFAGGAFCLLGIFLTVSRGGVLALSIALLAALFFAGRWRIYILLSAVLIAGVTFVYFTSFASESDRERISSSTQGENRVPDGRITIWALGRRMAAAHPVTGVGAGNFRNSAKDYLLQPGVLTRSDQVLISTPQVAHNSYLEVLAELGVVGLSLFLAILVFSLTSMLRAAKNFRIRGDPESEALARGFAVALIGALVADFFISQELSKQLWLLLGFGPALLALSTSAPDEAT